MSWTRATPPEVASGGLSHRPSAWTWPKLCGLVGAILAGCRSAPPPLPGPLAPAKVRLSLDHFAGSALSGPRAASLDAPSLEGSLWAQARVYAVEFVPGARNAPAASRARLLTAWRGDLPIVPVATLTAGALIDEMNESPDSTAGEAALDAALESSGFGRLVRLGSRDGPLVPGTTLSLAIAAPEGVAGSAVAAGDPVSSALGEERSVKLLISWPRSAEGSSPTEVAAATPGEPGALEVGVEVTAPAPAALTSEESPSAPPGASRSTQRELLLLEPRSASRRKALLVAVRSPFEGGEEAGWAFVVQVDSAASVEGEEKEARARTLESCVVRLLQPAQREPRGLEDREGVAPFEGLLERLKLSFQRRQTLLYLATSRGASAAADAALVAHDETLESIASRLMAAVSAAPADSFLLPGGALREQWLLERATLETFQEMLEKQTAPPEVEAVLLRQLGEVGRSAPLLGALCRDAADSADFAHKVRDENLLLLEDPSPASRVRALRWLLEKGVAPKGFDPLASSRDRRKALDAAQEELIRAASPAPASADPVPPKAFTERSDNHER